MKKTKVQKIKIELTLLQANILVKELPWLEVDDGDRRYNKAIRDLVGKTQDALDEID
jgi:hypothetical protein